MNQCDTDIEHQENLLQSDSAKKRSYRNSGHRNMMHSSCGVTYNDYYEWMGSAKEVRPISVTENVQWSTKSWFQRFTWYFGTCINMLTLTILSIRTDRFLDWNGYLKHHWKHYSGNITLNDRDCYVTG